MLLVMTGIWLRRRARAAAGPSTPDTSSATALDVARTLQLEGSPAPHHAPSARLEGGGAATSGEATRAALKENLQELLATGEPTPHTRECPGCGRTFPALMERCPYDGCALRVAAVDSPQGPQRACARCGRRYETDARYCPHDGLVLSDELVGRAAQATFRVCRTCGYEGPPDQTRCPHDDEALVPLESVEMAGVMPTVPLLRCRRCGRYGAMGQVRCPVDGTLMLPELNVRLTALPPTGFGPRRKICTRCGEAFSAHCDFCCFDGEALVGLN
ncbi:hypothetical protein DV096_17050 [Bradymonadaceae bacterium TMQ3]|nr:hypothetical protein DV096_17050 [Bradymonadaceae bacterium TMQ3]